MQVGGGLFASYSIHTSRAAGIIATVIPRIPTVLHSTPSLNTLHSLKTQHLPIVIPRSMFQLLDTLLTELIWGTGRRLIGLSKLPLTLHHRGLGAPDFKAYCYASQLQWLAYWIVGKNLQELAMTQTSWENGTLHKLLLPGVRAPPNPTHLLKIALGYWKKAIRYNKRLPEYAPNIPLLGIPLQTGVLTTRRLGSWEEEGVRSVDDFFVDGELLTHEEFIRVHGVPQTLFLLHAQISWYIRSTWSPMGNEPSMHRLINMQYLMGNGGVT